MKKDVAASEQTLDVEELRLDYQDLKSKGLKLDLTRGKPSAAQLDLSSSLLTLPGKSEFIAEGGIDTRNYGGLQGLIEARRLFSMMLGAPPEQIVATNNSSLALMHDVIVYCMIKGTCDSHVPWSRQQISFLCPVPGYDRHFAVTVEHGIQMIPVPLHEDGPDMDCVERLAAKDETIKGIWCVPKYSNPTGTIYSPTIIKRLSAMPTAAHDFRILWDNAYAVHHLTDERVEIANILDLCAAHNNPNRAFVFASTSKITLAGAGLAMFASSPSNVRWLLARLTPRTIGPDKVNQLRHVLLLRDQAGIDALMDAHRAIIAPKFQVVLDCFRSRFSGIANVRWSEPKGGYFISLEVPSGCAKHVVNLAKEAGVELTPAGSTHPYGIDPDDRIIRIAPTYPAVEDVYLAAEAVAVCVRLAAAEKLLERQPLNRGNIPTSK